MLGWLDADGELTGAAHALIHPPDSDWKVPAAEAFARAAAVRAWCAWSGVGSWRELDPESAEDFLCECSELSDSTAARRASCLGHWWRTLQDAPAPPSEAPPSPNEVDWLGQPLANGRFPTRILNWAARHGMETVGDLIARDPDQLGGEKNLGRKTLADSDAALQQLTGRSWKQLHASHPDTPLASTADAAHDSALCRRRAGTSTWRLAARRRGWCP